LSAYVAEKFLGCGIVIGAWKGEAREYLGKTMRSPLIGNAFNHPAKVQAPRGDS